MIPFLDLRAQYLSIKDEIDKAILDLLPTTQYTLGSQVATFEEEFAAYCGVKYGVGVNSGTSALHLALLAAGVGPGDEVVTVSCTFVATAAAVIYTGATPVFVDVDPESCTMDPSKLDAAITPRTKALIPVHLYGHSADMDPIMSIARRYGLTVIEDAAQAHGAHYNGRPVGSLGDMACFSFYPGKNLGAYGEAGIVVSNNQEYVRTMRMLRDWGQEKKYHHKVLGFNYRMEGIQGAVLRVKLQYLEKWTEARRDLARVYDSELACSGLTLPVESAACRHVYHLYTVRTSQRNNLQQALESKGVQTGIHYPIPVHLQEAYLYLGYVRGDLPVTEIIATETLSLPLFPELSASNVAIVCTETLNFLQR